MTGRTHHEAGSTHIIRYALELGLLWIDGSGRDKVREALAAMDALEAKLASIGAGGVQALSAPPAEADMFWDAEDGERFGNDIDDIISDFGPGDRVKINCAKRMPSIEVLVVADWDDLTYQIVSPTPPAEQQAASSAVLKAIREANMQLVRTGDDAFMLVPYKVATAEQQAAPKAAPGEPDPAGIIAGALQISRGHAIEMMREALEAAPQQEAQEPSKAYAWVYVNKYGVDSIPASKDWCATMVSGHGGSMFPLYTAPQPAPAPLSEREAFEAWIKKDGGDLGTFGTPPNMHYRNSAVNNAWVAWKARAALAAQGEKDAG